MLVKNYIILLPFVLVMLSALTGCNDDESGDVGCGDGVCELSEGETVCTCPEDCGGPDSSSSCIDSGPLPDAGTVCENDNSIDKLGYSGFYFPQGQPTQCPCDKPEFDTSCSAEGIECYYITAYCPDNPMGPEYEFEHYSYRCVDGKWDFGRKDCNDCCRM